MVPSTDAERVQTPAEIRKAREEHTVIVEALVGVDGLVKDARIAQSSGSAAADEAALREIRGSRLTPGTENGKPVEMWGRYSVAFTVND
jgi:TonB family protein